MIPSEPEIEKGRNYSGPTFNFGLFMYGKMKITTQGFVLDISGFSLYIISIVA